VSAGQRAPLAAILGTTSFSGSGRHAKWGVCWRLDARVGNRPAGGGPPRPATFRVARHRKKDADWNDAGFVLAAHASPRPRDATAAAWTLLDWRGLSVDIERRLTG
jgi:hypothetical protein